uniref:Uncharacterized protein n=1 Tax=viral metagenome TaxID=1070528 RepID=A0A6M3JVD9_9ZZZZ
MKCNNWISKLPENEREFGYQILLRIFQEQFEVTDAKMGELTKKAYDKSRGDTIRLIPKRDINHDRMLMIGG